MAKVSGLEAKAFVRIRDSVDKAESWELGEILNNEENKEIVIAVAEFIDAKEGDNPGTFSGAVVDDIHDLRDKKRMSKEEILEKMNRVIKEAIETSGGRRRRGKKTRKTRKSRRYTRRR